VRRPCACRIAILQRFKPTLLFAFHHFDEELIMTGTANPDVQGGQVHWRDVVSSRGRPFQVGSVEWSAQGPAISVPTSKQLFSIDVDWPLTDGKWKEAGQQVLAVASLSAYSLTEDQFLYKYILQFSNVKNYEFRFIDASDDYYTCTTYRTGTHFIRYNSDDPRIVHIYGY
jgi:hypothetical protein